MFDGGKIGIFLEINCMDLGLCGLMSWRWSCNRTEEKYHDSSMKKDTLGISTVYQMKVDLKGSGCENGDDVGGGGGEKKDGWK
jgi:hypothetical protein